MSTPDALSDLSLLVRSRHGMVHLDSDEEKRIGPLLRHLADRHKLPYFEWFPKKGLRRDGQKGIYGTDSPSGALAHIESARLPALYRLSHFGPSLLDSGLVPAIQAAADAMGGHDGALVFTGTDLEFPPSLRSKVAVVRLPAASVQEYKALLKTILRDLSSRTKVKIDITGQDINRLIGNLKGMTLFEAEKLLTRVILEDGRLGADDIEKVISAKRSIVEKDGLLEYYPASESMADIADLTGLKTWLHKRREIVLRPDQAREFGLSFPKGLLLLGVQGCGKSLCAKAVAMSWKLPLLKLDPSTLYNKYIGETEKNVRRAMALAEKMAPVILWIDEIEKAFSSGGDAQDSGVSSRLLGSFLTWMQERKQDVFVIATANDIQRLPPELMRKGRFDEIFFVDLPTREARRAIFDIHLKRRRRNPESFDLNALADLSEGFSGAEIEQSIVSGLYASFSEGRKLDTATLANEIAQTQPLSKTMKESVERLRAWARGRTVSAQ